MNEDIDDLFELPAGKKRLQASDMRAWLMQYRVGVRSSTVTNAFVAALLPYDEYNKESVNEAMALLGQKENALSCVYCGGIPTTWDHLVNLVQGRKANGPGHRIHNLVPCCKACNSSKGGKTFTDWILGYTHPTKGRIPGTARVSDDRREALVQLLTDYQKECPARSAEDAALEAKLMSMRDDILAILRQADKLVDEMRPPASKGNTAPSE